MEYFEESGHYGENLIKPQGQKTAEKLKKLGIKSPKGKMIKIDKRTWIVRKT